MKNRIEHTTFVVKRVLPGSPTFAFRFWSDPELKNRWAGCHADWTTLEEVFEFAEGGKEIKRWRTPEGDELYFRADYIDVVMGSRIIYAYEMSFGGKRLSASLVTIEFSADGPRTAVTVTEQAVFFGGGMQEQRILGTEEGYDRLVDVAGKAESDA